MAKHSFVTRRSLSVFNIEKIVQIPVVAVYFGIII